MSERTRLVVLPNTALKEVHLLISKIFLLAEK